MADERLRELERQAAGGEPGSEAKLLLERARTGDLGRAWLDLLALLGHPPACEALELPPPVADARGPLARWGKEAAVRIGRAALHPLTDRGDTLLELLDCASRWIVGDAAAREAEAERAETLRNRFGGWDHDHRAALVLAEVLAGADPEVSRLIPSVARALNFSGFAPHEEQPSCAGVWDAIRDALVPWILEQRGDPPGPNE